VCARARVCAHVHGSKHGCWQVFVKCEMEFVAG